MSETYIRWPVWKSDYVDTTDATVTTVATIACATGATTAIEVRVIARRTGGSSGTAEDGAFYAAFAAYKNAAGTAAAIGSSVAVAIESQVGWDVTFAASSGNALVQVTGAANNNVSWLCQYRVVGVTTL